MIALALLLLLPLVASKCPVGATEAYGQCYVTSSFVSIHANWAWLSPNTGSGIWLNSDGSALVFNNFNNMSYNPWGPLSGALINGQNGTWTVQQALSTLAYKFICQFPNCNLDGSMPPSILPRNDDNDLVYSQVSSSFFYTTLLQQAQISEAETMCAEIGGHLPGVSNAFQNDDLLKAVNQCSQGLGNGKIPLGLYSDFRSVWHWTDGRPTGYTNWQPKAITSASNLRTLMDPKSGLWFASSDLPNIFMCQFPIDNRKC